MAATLLQEISQDERERARLRSRRMYETDKYSDYHTAIEIGEIREREKSQRVIKEKDTVIAEKEKTIADKDLKLADKDAMLADMQAEIARLRAELDKRQ